MLARSGSTRLVGVTGSRTPRTPSLSRSPSIDRCALLLIPKRPSLSVGGGDTLLADPGPVFPGDRLKDGVLSFHRATIFRTDARGDLGDVCGRRRVDVGVIDVPVNVPVPV